MPIFDKLSQYNTIIAYELKEDSINSFIKYNPSKIAYIDLSTSQSLKSEFISHYKITQLPCMISFGEVAYINSQLEEILSLINEKESLHYKNMIQGLVNSSKYFIFIKGTPQSPKCKFTRQLLALFGEINENNFKSFDVLEDEKMREKCKEINNWSTFPQIFKEGVFIGGLNKFRELIIKTPTDI